MTQAIPSVTLAVPSVALVDIIFFCPRCDKKFSSQVSALEVEKNVKIHVAEAHPDYDTNWFETYPDSVHIEGAS